MAAIFHILQALFWTICALLVMNNSLCWKFSNFFRSFSKRWRGQNDPSVIFKPIFGDPGADSGGKGKSKRQKNMARRKVKNGKKSPWGQCLTRPVPNGRRRSAFWLGRKTQKFSGTNQKSERWRPFGTGLVRHCPQGLFSPFLYFSSCHIFLPFRLSLTPTMCPWVSEDVSNPENVFK